MQQWARFISAWAYRKIAKPLLFHAAPDDVHAAMIRAARLTQRSRILRGLESAAWAYRDEAHLRQTVCGLSFSNPIGLSAGLDKNAEIVPTVQAIGFGFMTVGSITALAAEGNPRPWYHRLPQTKSIVVNAGLPNDGVRMIRTRLADYDKKMFHDFPVIASIAKTNSPATCNDDAGVEDYLKGIRGIRLTSNVRLIEINISCPNTYGGEPFTRPEPLEALLKGVDRLSLTQPVFIKMPIDKPWHQFDELLQVISLHHVAGVTIGNLQKDRRHVVLKDPLPESIPGNLSGAPCYEDSNELIRRTYQKYGKKLIIIGVGGVFDAEQAYAKIKAGATLVDMITGLIFGGPQVVGEINHDLVKLLVRDGYQNVAEAIGVDTIAK